MFIITRIVHDYNQHGSYFVAAWVNKPSKIQISKTLPYFNTVHVDFLVDLGYVKYHNTEYYLEEYTEGVIYK